MNDTKAFEDNGNVFICYMEKKSVNKEEKLWMKELKNYQKY